MFIDTHCHLSINDYEDIEEVINEMNGNIIVASGCDDKTNHEVISLVKKYSNVYGTIGLHPSEVAKDIDLKYIEENLLNPKIVGIGEIGLDYFHDQNSKELQKELFIKQIKLAKKYNKTIVIHSRDAIEDTINIIKEYNLDKHKTIMHCYSSSLEVAKILTQMNIYLGIGGVLTFKNSKKLKEVVKDIDLKYLVLETDSPYLTPEPFRGKQNKPYNCYYVAKKIAKIKNISQEEVFEITTENAIRQFDLNL